MATKPSPKLFQTRPGFDKWDDVLTSGVTQIFVGKPEGKEEVEGAWDALMQGLKGEGVVKGWSGWGVEDNEGMFVGLVGWDGLEVRSC